MASKTDTSTDIRQRLLEAAGRIFAEKGYAKATIREICDRADANVASVNYHFHDKEALYRAVFDFAHQSVRDQMALVMGGLQEGSAEERLRLFIRMQVTSLLGVEGPPDWFSTLMTREMIEPTHLQRDMVEREIRPRSNHLLATIRELLGEAATDEEVRHAALSVVGQFVFYKLARPLNDIIHPGLEYTPEAIERRADHIADFSLAGIAALRERIRKRGGG